MSRGDLALFVLGILLAIGIVCEAEAEPASAPRSSEQTPLVRGSAEGSTPVGLQAQEPRCDTPVIDWPTEPGQRTCGEWRCLTRRAWAEQVMRPERELTRCTRELAAGTRLSAQLEAAHRAAVGDAIEARQEADRMRRQRWHYLAGGAIVGVALTAGVTYGAVRVLEAR